MVGRKAGCDDRDTGGHELAEEGRDEDDHPWEAEAAAVRELVRAARARGEELTGPDGLLKLITRQVLEAALEEEMSEHVGYDKHAVQGRNGGNSRNGTRTKTVLTENAGSIEVAVPRDRDGTFEPVIVKKRQRRLNDVDAVVLSLYARGLTTGEISAHFAEVYGERVQGHRQPDHRQGVGGHASLGVAALAAGVRRDLHRRDHGEGP